jgi:hypothetical protein
MIRARPPRSINTTNRYVNITNSSVIIKGKKPGSVEIRGTLNTQISKPFFAALPPDVRKRLCPSGKVSLLFLGYALKFPDRVTMRQGSTSMIFCAKQAGA